MLENLRLVNFRNIADLSLRFEKQSVIFHGANGQGKTSVLEALFYLATLRSFRTRNVPEMIRINERHASVSAGISFGTWSRRYSVELDTVRRLRIDGAAVARASDFAGAFSIVAFLPDDPEIVTGRSLGRRKFFDMFISMLDRGYFTSLQRYSMALKSRNCLLKRRNTDRALLQAYHPLLAKTGSLIEQKRKMYASILSEFMHENLMRIRPEFSDFQIRMRGSPEDEDAFLARLEANLDRDRQNGYTMFGPQTDDFDFLFDGKLLRLYGSRGQCRIVSLALKLAEFDILRNHSISRDNTVVLIDDATGDLDERAKEAFFEKIKSAGQVFYTFTDLNNKELADRSQVITLSAGKAVQENSCITR